MTRFFFFFFFWCPVWNSTYPNWHGFYWTICPAYSGLYWKYPLAGKVGQWFQKFNHLNFSKNYSGLKLPNLNFVACVKVCISSKELSTRSTFSNHIHYFIYIFNVSFHLISCQEFCKYYMCYWVTMHCACTFNNWWLIKK